MGPQPTYEQRRRAGAALRRAVPRSAHAAWSPAGCRPDPVAVLEENNRARLPDLVPVRYGRTLTSPFAFLRGSAVDRAVPRSQGDPARVRSTCMPAEVLARADDGMVAGPPIGDDRQAGREDR